MLIRAYSTHRSSRQAVRFGLDVGVDGASTTYVACSVVSAAYHSISVRLVLDQYVLDVAQLTPLRVFYRRSLFLSSPWNGGDLSDEHASIPSYALYGYKSVAELLGRLYTHVRDSCAQIDCFFVPQITDSSVPSPSDIKFVRQRASFCSEIVHSI